MFFRIFSKNIKLIIFFLIFSYFFILPNICRAQIITIEQMQNLIEANPDLKIAKKDYEIAKMQVELDKIALYPTLFGSVTYNNYSNPVQTSTYNVYTTNQNGISNSYTETLTPLQERYNELSTNIGLNIPLFGTRQSLKQNLALSESLEKQKAAEIDLKRWQSYKSLIYAYSEYYIRLIQLDLANKFLNNEQQIKDMLLERQRAGLILESDRLELNTDFAVVKRNESVYLKQEQDALNVLKLITANDLYDFQPVYPKLNTDFITPQFILDSMYKNPQIKIYAEKLEGYKKVLGEASSMFSSGNFSISGGIQSGFQGSAGWNVMAALTLSMPFSDKKWQDVSHSKNLLNVQKAQLELDYQEKAYKDAANSYYLWLQSRYENLRTAKDRFDAALASYKIAKLRSSIDPGDYFYNVIKSKYYLYQTANDYLEAALDLFKAKADILGLVGFSDNVYKNSDFDKSNEDLISKISDIFDSSKIIEKTSDGKYLNWYAWNGFELYKNLGENFWLKLPRSTKRIFLSLNKTEIQRVSSNQNGANNLNNFIQEANKRDIKVDLLLGDPDWVLDKYRSKLIGIIAKLSKFNFSGIQLDIEKNQLPEGERNFWDEGIVKTISEVHASTLLPIGLSMNYKEAENHKLLEDLRAAGLNEVILMIYTTNTNKIIEIGDKIMKENPKLYFSIALSFEPVNVLPDGETFATIGANNSLAIWKNLYENLWMQNNNFNGITIQSLKDFWSLKNEN